MSTSQIASSVQIKITLPSQLQAFAQSKADRYGLTLSTYIRHLVLDDVKDMDMPVFQMSKKTESVVEQALQDYAQGKTHPIEDIDTFLNTP